MLARPRSHPDPIDPHASEGRLVEAFDEVLDLGQHLLVPNGLGRLVPVHHHDPLEVGAGAGYCVQTLERLTSPDSGGSASPSAELMVDPESGARCAIRDTRAAGAERYHWTVTVIGKPGPVAAGRTGDAAEARSQAEAGAERLRGGCGDRDDLAVELRNG